MQLTSLVTGSVAILARYFCGSDSCDRDELEVNVICSPFAFTIDTGIRRWMAVFGSEESDKGELSREVRSELNEGCCK